MSNLGKSLEPGRLKEALGRIDQAGYHVGPLVEIESYAVLISNIERRYYTVRISAFYIRDEITERREIQHIELACTCRGGQHGHACKHMALALDTHLPGVLEALTEGVYPGEVWAYKELP